jgi:hypothetical protein
MAKLDSEPVDKPLIQQYLAENDDFAFEIRCLRELRKRPLTIEHAGTYSDPVTNKSRQFDIRVRVDHDYRQIALAVECKNLKSNFPLVVSRLPRTSHEAFHHLLIPGDSRLLRPSESRSILAPGSFYKENHMVGKSTVQVGRTKDSKLLHGDDSEVHDKWAQAVSSAYELISDAADKVASPETGIVAVFVLPVVVVPNQMLWVVDYSTDGDLIGEPNRIEETDFFLDHSPWRMGQFFSYTVSHLHFVTLNGLLSLADRLVANPKFINTIFPE